MRRTEERNNMLDVVNISGNKEDIQIRENVLKP